jgi:hypothetical protein
MHAQAIAKGIPLVVYVITAQATAMPRVLIVIVFFRM